MPSSWGTVEDLKNQYGGEQVEKLATKSFWDADINDYVVDRSPEKIEGIIQSALDKGKSLLFAILNARFSNASATNDILFPSVNFYHLKISYMILKDGSTCQACKDCLCEFKECVDTDQICVDGICLKKASGISVSKGFKSKCDGCGCGDCCCG